MFTYATPVLAWQAIEGGNAAAAGDCPSCRGELPQDGSSAQLWSSYSTVGPVTVWFTLGVGIGSNPRGHYVPADAPLPLSRADLYPAGERAFPHFVRPF
jgi:hypothetical protein